MNSFSVRLRLALKEKGWSQAELSRQTGIGRNSISDYLKGKYEAKQDKLYILAKALNVNEAWLMGYSVSKKRLPDEALEQHSIELKESLIDENTTELMAKTVDIMKKLQISRQVKTFQFAKEQLDEQNEPKIVPLVGKTAAGPALTYGDTVYDETIETNVPKGADKALVIQGDSMEPLLKDGSIVFYKETPEIENGEIAIVEIDRNEVTCKKVYFNYDDNIVILKSINDYYKDFELEPERIRVIGKVIH